MVSPVNSSKAVYGFVAVAALAVGTVLYLRSRRNARSLQTSPALDQKNVSFMAGLPVIGRIYSIFYRVQPIEQGAVSALSIGSNTARYKSVEDLAQELKKVEARPGSINTLIIYGNNLELIKDPGILALEPMKLILVGITIGTDSSDTSLDSQMSVQGWTVIKVASVQEALEAVLPTNQHTNAPIPTVYIV